LPGETTRRCKIDRTLLRQQALEPIAYRKTLSKTLFDDRDLERFFTDACAGAERLGCPLHLRLRLTSKVAWLHGLRWETLLDPRDDSLLAVNQRVLFSRFIDTPHYRLPRARRPRERLRAVVAIADPENIQQYPRWGPLSRICVAGERERAETALAGLETEFLVDPGQANLENLAFFAGDGCDILYLTCHGVLDGTEPLLVLVNDKNEVAVTSGRDLLERVKRWLVQPHIVVLASCQSAGREEEPRLDEFGALAALGPRLAAAGVPAVLAMQGDVTFDTVKVFFPPFFETLMGSGSIDHAMTAARGRAYDRKRPDFWMPVLFSRMPAGRLWYNPGVSTSSGLFAPAPREEAEFRFWDGLLANIARGECTPVLGFGLLESVIGQREDIADQWADRYGYPLGRSDRCDLTRMAQFLAVDQENEKVPGNQLLRYLRAEMLDRLPEADQHAAHSFDLQHLLIQVADLTKSIGVQDLLATLAELPFRVYLSTTPDNLLEAALRNAEIQINRDGRQVRVHKDPQVRFFRWWEDQIQPMEPVELERPDRTKLRQPTLGRPPESRPLVYRMFGDLGEEDTLVLTEDNHFDYLVAMTRAMATPDGSTSGHRVRFTTWWTVYQVRWPGAIPHNLPNRHKSTRWPCWGDPPVRSAPRCPEVDDNGDRRIQDLRSPVPASVLLHTSDRSPRSPRVIGVRPLIIIGPGPVPTPLADIPMHAMEAEGVRLLLPHRVSLRVRVG
jgi:hypothetical protein